MSTRTRHHQPQPGWRTAHHACPGTPAGKTCSGRPAGNGRRERLAARPRCPDGLPRWAATEVLVRRWRARTRKTLDDEINVPPGTASQLIADLLRVQGQFGILPDRAAWLAQSVSNRPPPPGNVTAESPQRRRHGNDPAAPNARTPYETRLPSHNALPPPHAATWPAAFHSRKRHDPTSPVVPIRMLRGEGPTTIHGGIR